MNAAEAYAIKYKAYQMIRIHLQREKRVVEMVHGLDSRKTVFRKRPINNALFALELLKPIPTETPERDKRP